MAARGYEIYQCRTCGAIVETIRPGKGKLTCCGATMEVLEEQPGPDVTQTHVPVVVRTDKAVVVKVGQVPHPVVESDYIQWIELVVNDQVIRQYLQPGQPAEATFYVQGGKIVARAHCSAHGLWRSQP